MYCHKTNHLNRDANSEIFYLCSEKGTKLFLSNAFSATQRFWIFLDCDWHADDHIVIRLCDVYG